MACCLEARSRFSNENQEITKSKGQGEVRSRNRECDLRGVLNSLLRMTKETSANYQIHCGEALDQSWVRRSDEMPLGDSIASEQGQLSVMLTLLRPFMMGEDSWWRGATRLRMFTIWWMNCSPGWKNGECGTNGNWKGKGRRLCHFKKQKRRTVSNPKKYFEKPIIEAPSLSNCILSSSHSV